MLTLGNGVMAVQNLGKAADFKDKVDLHMGVSIRPPR